MTKSARGITELWGEVASQQFLRLPTELLYHYKEIGLSDEDKTIIEWIDLYQWGERAAFPHPIKLASILKISHSEAIQKLQSLSIRGFITLEPTKNGLNFYQDIRPARNKLREYLNANPNHCALIKKDFKKGIDTSSNRSTLVPDTSNSIDTSIPERGKTTTSVGEEINKKRYNKR